jgi:hypothetical protein
MHTQDDFITIVESIFEQNNNLGIIASKKGVFKNDEEALFFFQIKKLNIYAMNL